MGRKRSFANLALLRPILVILQLNSTPNWHFPVAGSPSESIQFMFAIYQQSTSTFYVLQMLEGPVINQTVFFPLYFKILKN